MATPKKAIKEKIKGANAFTTLSAPAQKALAAKNITTVKQLSKHTEAEILQLHGMGQGSILKLTDILKTAGLSFKKNNPETTVTKSTDTAAVELYMKQLKHPMKQVAETVRQIILSADKTVGEEIAWNVPSFFYTGAMKPFNPKEYKRFIVCFNFFKKDCLRLIFLTGAKLNDASGLLQGDYADGRRIALFYSMQEVKLKEKVLKQLIKKWLRLLDK